MFFDRVFGFKELPYDETHAKMLEASTFSSVSEADLDLWRILDDVNSVNPASITTATLTDGACEETLKRTSSMCAGEAEGTLPLERQAIGERCVIRLKGKPTAGILRIPGLDPEVEIVEGLRDLHAGVFSTPSLGELRDRVRRVTDSLTPFEKQTLANLSGNRILTMVNTNGDSRDLHSTPEYHHSVIQAASQFNYLEFPGPGVTPEKGIANYIFDRTQGPACCRMCARHCVSKLPCEDARRIPRAA